MSETRLQAIERRLKRGWIYMQPADVEELLSLLKECRGVIEDFMWHLPTEVPPRSKPGVASDFFLCLTIDSAVPKVLVYVHDEKQWTEGGDDTQRIRLWKAIPHEESARQTLAKLE